MASGWVLDVHSYRISLLRQHQHTSRELDGMKHQASDQAYRCHCSGMLRIMASGWVLDVHSYRISLLRQHQHIFREVDGMKQQKAMTTESRVDLLKKV